MASHQAAYMAHHQHQQLAPHQQLPPPPSYVSSSSSQHSHHYPALPSMTQQPNQMSMPQASSSSSSSAAAAAPASTPGRTPLTDQQELQEKNLTPFSRKDKKGWIYSQVVVSCRVELWLTLAGSMSCNNPNELECAALAIR